MPDTPTPTGGRFDITKPVTVEVTMNVKGYLLHDEDQEKAEARIALWSEQRINAFADIRAHITKINKEKV